MMYATDKDKQEYEETMRNGLDQALIDALGAEKKEGGRSLKVPKPPRGRGQA